MISKAIGYNGVLTIFRHTQIGIYHIIHRFTIINHYLMGKSTINPCCLNHFEIPWIFPWTPASKSPTVGLSCHRNSGAMGSRSRSATWFFPTSSMSDSYNMLQLWKMDEHGPWKIDSWMIYHMIYLLKLVMLFFFHSCVKLRVPEGSRG